MNLFATLNVFYYSNPHNISFKIEGEKGFINMVSFSCNLIFYKFINIKGRNLLAYLVKMLPL